MTRRLAILDDNQRVLEERLAALHATLPRLVGERVSAAMVIGSVADGRARDTDEGRFPIQPVIVGRAALAGTEPHLAAALRHGIVVWDPEGLFDDQPRPGA